MPADPVLRNVYASFSFWNVFCYRVRILYGTDRQTNARTDGQYLLCGLVVLPCSIKDGRIILSDVGHTIRREKYEIGVIRVRRAMICRR